MSRCPDIDSLLDDPHGTCGVHVGECRACSAIDSLGRVRAARLADSGSQHGCESFEPFLAAMIDGAIRAAEVPGLCEHLASCARCSDIAATLTLLQSELSDVPDPVEQCISQCRARRTSSSTRALRRTAALAAALLACLGIAFAYWKARWPFHAGSQGTVAPALNPPVNSQVLPQSTPHIATSAVAENAPIQLEAQTPTATTAAGYLSIQCTPGCDQVLVDGASLGAAPIARRATAAGTHLVTLRYGDSVKSVKVLVQAGEESNLAVNMEAAPLDGGTQPPASGFLTVVCSPYCDSVELGGKNMGPSPLFRVPVKPGTYPAVLRRGSAVIKLQVVITSGQSTIHRVQMPEPGTGYLNVECNPSCDAVLVDGVNAGASPVVRREVTAGTHAVTLKSGRLEKSISVRVSVGQTSSIRASMTH